MVVEHFFACFVLFFLDMDGKIAPPALTIHTRNETAWDLKIFKKTPGCTHGCVKIFTSTWSKTQWVGRFRRSDWSYFNLFENCILIGGYIFKVFRLVKSAIVLKYVVF